jgi:N6-L-threonylcarbamoyladenine synthase
MYVLGIETSCDETAASVVKDGKRICSNVVSSSLSFHKKYGGIIPEIAFRMQLETIAQVADSSIKEAGISLREVKLVSVTNGPGLLGSLLVGISFAQSVSLSLDVPLLGVDHLQSHIYSSLLNGQALPLPFVALVASGGHTSLFYVKDFGAIKLLGSTLDDACGEAFDKVAKILGLGYPGGPLIESMAKKGNPKKIKFNCSDTREPLDFSFSGIKTAVLYYVRRLAGCQLSSSNRQTGKQANRQTEDIAASFQEAVIDTLVRKASLACRMKNVNRLLVGGGVAANSRLREKFLQAGIGKGVKVYFPARQLCMDNAAMVAGLGYQLFKKGYQSDLSLNAD